MGSGLYTARSTGSRVETGQRQVPVAYWFGSSVFPKQYEVTVSGEPDGCCEEF